MKKFMAFSTTFYLLNLSFAKGDTTCRLIGFLPFTPSKGNEILIPHDSRAFSHLAAAFLAIADFNSRNTSVITELGNQVYQKCDVNIPEGKSEFYDTHAVPKSLMRKQKAGTKYILPPCVIVGPYSNQPTLEASVVAQGWEIPVISHGAEMNSLSRKIHPTVFKSSVNIHAMGEVIIQFLIVMKRTDYLGCIFLPLEFSLLSQEAVLNAAKKSEGMFNYLNVQKVTPQSLTKNSTELHSARYAMTMLKESKFRTIFITIENVSHLSVLADVAEECQMNRGDYVYVIVVPNEFELDAIMSKAESNSNVTRLVKGAAILRMLDGFMYNPILNNTDRFLNHWQDQNSSLILRINSALNQTKEKDSSIKEKYAQSDYFQTQKPLQGSAFMYDAVMMAGMAKCQADRAKDNSTKKSKKKSVAGHVQELARLIFNGATGSISFGEGNRFPRNRKRESVTYGVYNYQITSNDTLKYYLTHVITNGTVNGKFTPTDNSFIFADGGVHLPTERQPLDYNYLSDVSPGQSFCLVLMSLCLFSNLLGVALVFCYSKTQPIQDAHPYLLYFLLFGLTIASTSIFTQSFDEKDNWEVYQLNRMCMAFPWLLVIGFTMTYTALLFKLFIMKGQKRISIILNVIMMPLCVLIIFIIIIVMLVFTLSSSVYWDRSVMDSNPIISYGRCSTDGTDSKLMYAIVVLFAIILILTAYMANEIKNLDESFSEARWISTSAISHLQILVIGIPILILNSEFNNDQPVIRSILVFVSCFSTTILIFGPKAYNIFFYDVKMSDLVWIVNFSDLTFNDPPEVIGRGTFGLVLLAEYRGTNVAVKHVIHPKQNNHLKAGTSDTFSNERSTSKTIIEGSSTSKMGSSSSNRKNDSLSRKLMTADFILEMRQLSKLRHPNIITIIGAIVSKNEEPMMIMEYMEYGSLYDVLHNETMLLEGEMIFPILLDIAQGLRFLHAASPAIIHGDLKAANVLVDSRFRAKVADFGLSQKRYGEINYNKNFQITGTPYWMAPELLSCESGNSTATDLYSFGIILFELYSRKNPYEGEKSEEVLKMIADPKICKRPTGLISCPQEVQDIMTECLKHDPKERPNFSDLDIHLRSLNIEKVEPKDMILSLQEKKKSHTLLYDVFPQHIAEALCDGRKVEPESRSNVTIFFSDIVGFTNISSTLEPIKISLMLDRLYHNFDEISRKYDVFKVETIGDAYMAVTNLVKEQPDHTKRIADFAIEAVKIANETLIDLDNPDRGFLNIRVGFHSGPVVANVVGSRNPRYCLFGDTVNTSSRMESNSIENRIHCSHVAAKLLREQDPDIPMESRGIIAVKGKGKMQTYWVNEGIKGSCVHDDNVSDDLISIAMANTKPVKSGDKTKRRMSFPTNNKKNPHRRSTWLANKILDLNDVESNLEL